MNIVSDKKGVALVLTGSLTKCHPFGRSSRLVQQRSVSHLHCGQVHHHLLEIQQRLETSLRNLSLIRSISGVPTRILQNVSLDHLWHMSPVVTHADVRLVDFVLLTKFLQLTQRLRLRKRSSQIKFFSQQNISRNGRSDKLRQRRRANRLQHHFDLVRTRTKVAIDKFVVPQKLIKRLRG